MKKAWAIGGLVSLIAGPAMVQAADPAPPENRYSAVQAQRQAEREHIHQERQAIAATRKREETACYRRFAVEDCLRDVRTQARRAELQLRGRELQLNDAERKEKAAERLRSIEEKQRVAPTVRNPKARHEGRGVVLPSAWRICARSVNETHSSGPSSSEPASSRALQTRRSVPGKALSGRPRRSPAMLKT